ncbi:unnamed protein product [Arctogadus glacialis]
MAVSRSLAIKEQSGEPDTENPKTTSPGAPQNKNTMATSAVVILMEIQPKNGEEPFKAEQELQSEAIGYCSPSVAR